MWYAFIFSTTFYVILLAVGLFGYGLIKATPLKKLPVFNNRKTLMIAAVIGIVITSGFLGGLGSLGTASLGGGVLISDLQITTDFVSNGSGTVTENSNVDDLLDARYTDAQLNETDGTYEVVGGIVTVTRTGSLEPMSCTVKSRVPAKYQDQSSPDGTTYSIIEQDAIGKYEIYLADGSSATVNSPKETVQLSFSDGEASTTLGILMEGDEQGHDALDQYSYKDVIVDICGKPLTVRMHRMDA